MVIPRHPAAVPLPDPVGRGLVPLLRVFRVVVLKIHRLVCLCQVSSSSCSWRYELAQSAHQSLSSLKRLVCAFWQTGQMISIFVGDNRPLFVKEVLVVAHESVERLKDGLLSTPQLEYIEWLCDPQRQGSKKEWARDHGFAESTIFRWQNDRWFKQAYEQRLAELNVSPDRIQAVVDALWAAASRGDTKAASLYLQYVDRLQPKRVVIEDARVAGLSDEELRAELDALLGDS